MCATSRNDVTLATQEAAAASSIDKSNLVIPRPWPVPISARSDTLARLFARLDSIFGVELIGRDELRKFAEMNLFETGTQRGAQVVVAKYVPAQVANAGIFLVYVGAVSEVSYHR
jgi:hypothetical protein